MISFRTKNKKKKKKFWNFALKKKNEILYYEFSSNNIKLGDSCLPRETEKVEDLSANFFQ